MTKATTIAGGLGAAYLLIGVWRYLLARKEAARNPGDGSMNPSPSLILLWPKQISGPFAG